MTLGRRLHAGNSNNKDIECGVTTRLSMTRPGEQRLSEGRHSFKEPRTLGLKKMDLSWGWVGEVVHPTVSDSRDQGREVTESEPGLGNVVTFQRIKIK